MMLAAYILFFLLNLVSLAVNLPSAVKGKMGNLIVVFLNGGVAVLLAAIIIRELWQ